MQRTPVPLLFAIVFTLLAGCANKTASGTKEILTIACWISDTPLSLCVDEFNKNSDDYEIQIYEYYDPTEQDYNAAMTRMRIDLIANDVCDLIYLDSMDIYALENAGLLMDLNPLIATDMQFNVDDYYWNIWSLYQREGKLYEWIPAFELTGVFGPSTILSDIDSWTIDEYKQFSASTGQSIGSIAPATMICSMLQYTNHSLISPENGICNLNSEEFKEWLAFSKDFDSSNGILWLNWIRGLNEYLSWQIDFGAPICLVNVPATQQSSICASAHFSFGISSKTEHTSVCWDFLKSIMEDKLLNQLTLGVEPVGFPMKRALFSEQLARAMLPVSDSDAIIYNWGDSAISLTRADKTRLTNQVENINCVQKRISAVLDIVIDESEAYFNGDKSLNDTTKIIQSRSGIYLSEQQ